MNFERILRFAESYFNILCRITIQEKSMTILNKELLLGMPLLYSTKTKNSLLLVSKYKENPQNSNRNILKISILSIFHNKD